MEKRDRPVGAEHGNDAKRMRMNGPGGPGSFPAPSGPKVTFLTKKQRERLALQQKQEAEEAERLKAEKQEVLRREFLLSEELQREKERQLRMKERERAREKKEERRTKEENAHREQKEKRPSDIQPGSGDRQDRQSSSLAHLDMLRLPESEKRARQQEKELAQIKEHYLGMRREKKKVQKPSEKFRNIFTFEWDTSEDTNRDDSNPIYQEKREPQLLFGRGFRAGIDVREQRRQNNFYDELVKRRAEQSGEDISAFVKARNQADEKGASLKSRDIEENDPAKRHWTEKKREEMNDRDWRIFREDFEIYIKGGRVPAPIRTWAESPLPWELLEAVRKVGYAKPTAIQMQAIPIALEMRDCIGIAETGSGKTAAFVLPMLTYVKQLPPLNDETSQDGPYALVLAPSRELALQIEEETKKFASFCQCRSVAVVGGRNAESQAFELRRGCEVVIGTPGRVKDCLEKSYTVLNQCAYLVLDEADRMIDMGFEEIVNWILDQIPSSNLKSENEDQATKEELEAKAGHRKYRITHMFSATMPPAVERLARKYLRAPAYISIGDPGAGKRAIEQRLEFMAEAKKKQRLQEILEEATPPVMVFVNQKKVADVLAKSLDKMNFKATSLHGGKAQEIREAALAGFKDGTYDVLVATDVAGRGIDVEGVQHVINFDMPKNIEDYTHRIGRTGRAGKKGVSTSFVTDEDSHLLQDLRTLVRRRRLACLPVRFFYC
mmetsp:Transcript_16321/g.39113  ORF Transcript_16321/g.39113 Transcript_16321/m.39113 type:complete len:722 (-) Transcript_16321:859-3024(-)